MQKPFPFPGNRRDQLRASRVYKHGSHRPSMFKAKFKLKLLHPQDGRHFQFPSTGGGGGNNNNNIQKRQGRSQGGVAAQSGGGENGGSDFGSLPSDLGAREKAREGAPVHHHHRPPPSPSARSGRGRPPPLTGLEERNRSSLSLAHSPGRCKRREGRKARSGPASRCLQEMTQAAKEAEEARFPSTGIYLFIFTCFAAGAA